MYVSVDKSGESERAMRRNTVGERLQRRSLAVQEGQTLHQQFGTLDVCHQGNRILYGNPPGYVTLGD